MKKGITKSLLLVLIIASMMLSACTGNSNNTNNSPGTTPNSTTGEANGEKEEIVTLRVLVIEPGTKWNTYPDSAVAQEIAKKIGVKIEYVEADENKFNVLMAGGDLPDIVRAGHDKYGKQLIDGNMIIAMDDLLESHGKDIKANVSSLIDYSRKNWSLGQDKLYFLPPQVRANPSPVYANLTIGPTIRWDLYKEIGAPEIKTPDDLLNVIEQIVEKYPQTEDGRKMYGFSMWQDWGLWPYVYPFAWNTAELPATDSITRIVGTHEHYSMFTNENSNYWQAMSFYREANKRGLLDPDAFTMKHNDYLAKATAGQIVIGPATWAMGDFNSQYAKDGRGYVVLPVGTYAWNGGIDPIGWKDKGYSISTNTKHPEKAMEFLNYIYSYEGARTMYSGVEGVHWEMVDGKPQLKEETFELRTTGGDAWDRTGIALDVNLIGIGKTVFDPANDTPVDLFSTEAALAKNVTVLEKDFSEYYGAIYPGGVLAKRIEDGTLIDSNTQYEGMTNEEIIIQGTIVAPTLSEDQKRIQAELVEMAARTAPKLILAKTDAEFEKFKQEALAEFKAGGADELVEWYQEEYTKNFKAAGAK